MLPTLETRNLRHREIRSPAHGHTAGKRLNWGLHAIFNAELRVLPVAPAPRSSSGGAQWGELGDALVNTTLDPSGAGPTHLGAQACVTQTNRTGFLCDDRSSCIPASRVCDGVRTCARGEDEEQALCREYLCQGPLRAAPTPALPAARLKLDHPECTRHPCVLLCLWLYTARNIFSHPVPVTCTHICPHKGMPPF